MPGRTGKSLIEPRIIRAIPEAFRGLFIMSEKVDNAKEVISMQMMIGGGVDVDGLANHTRGI